MSAIKPLSYFLYDNRTRASWGHDWGLKIATGQLADQETIRQQFVDYCNLSFDSGAGLPVGFGYALGGFPALGIGGYILCVTLETLDHLERHSCAVVGLLFATLTELRWFLEYCDAEATARSAVSEPIPPKQLVPRERSKGRVEHGALWQSWIRCRTDGQLLVEQFRPNETPLEVANLLRELTSAFMTLPAVLGITSVFRPLEMESAGYRVAFCLPTSSRSRIALEQYCTLQKVRGQQPQQETHISSPTDQRIWPPGHRKTWIVATALLSALVILVIGVSKILSGPGVELPAPSSSATKIATPSPHLLPSASADSEPTHPDLDFLTEIDHLTEQLAALSPQDLYKTQAFQLLEEVRVVPEHTDDRANLLAELNRLPARRKQLIGTSGTSFNLRYYFETESGSTLSTDRKAKEIRARLRSAQLPTDACVLLRAHLLFALERETGALQDWCTCLNRISQLAAGGGGSKGGGG